MKAIVAIDSFKGSLSTFEAGAAVRDGILRVYKNASVTVCPLADGGEGTVDAIVSSQNGEYVEVSVTGPLGKPVTAKYGLLRDKNTAVIEMSAAAGITLIDEAQRNPLYTTTYGVGEMIKHAITTRGCKNFLVGIGGSATNDGGVGMLQALGFEFFDSDGKQISQGASGLSSLAKISSENAFPLLKDCSFKIACDVQNPLCGDLGCSAVYAPQKGATPQMVADMDGWLSVYAKLTSRIVGSDFSTVPGAGAAGGLGFAFLAYLNGSLESGIKMVIEATELDKAIAEADIVITGEGRLDRQSCMGKAPMGVANAAKKFQKPVIAFSGCVTDDARMCNGRGIDAFFPILKAPCSLEEAMDKNTAYRNLSDTAEQGFRLLRIGSFFKNE